MASIKEKIARTPMRAWACWACLLVSACVQKPPDIKPVATNQAAEQASIVRGITHDEAVAIANKEVVKVYGSSLDRFKVVACEQEIFWRIIYDGGGPEYLLDKLSGKILRSQEIPQDPREPNQKPKNGASVITEAEAIAIAKHDMSLQAPHDDLETYAVHACELEKAWRVVIESKIRLEPNQKIPAVPNASTPNYVIDKRTGKILFKQRT